MGSCHNYTLDPTSSVISLVTTYSGVGIVTGSGGVSTPTPTVGSTPTATPTPVSTRTPAPTLTPTPTASSSASCRVTYTVTSQWSGGFTASLAITNTGSTAWSSWTLAFSFPAGQTITQIWNASASQTGGAVTITNASYNGAVAPGASVSPAPGFNGTWTGSNPNPTAFILNGARCSVA